MGNLTCIFFLIACEFLGSCPYTIDETMGSHIWYPSCAMGVLRGSEDGLYTTIVPSLAKRNISSFRLRRSAVEGANAFNLVAPPSSKYCIRRNRDPAKFKSPNAKENW